MRPRSRKSPWTTAGAAVRPATITARKSLDRAAKPATREPDRPNVLQRDVMEQSVHAKGAHSEFTRVDAHIASSFSVAGCGCLYCARGGTLIHTSGHVGAVG